MLGRQRAAPSCTQNLIAERGLFQTVLRESWKESLERPLPNLIEDFGGLSLLKHCEAVHSEDVVDSTDAKTRGEGKILSQGPDTVKQGERANIVDAPLRWSCVHVSDVTNYFCFLRLSFCSNLCVSSVERL